MVTQPLSDQEWAAVDLYILSGALLGAITKARRLGVGNVADLRQAAVVLKAVRDTANPRIVETATSGEVVR